MSTTTIVTLYSDKEKQDVILPRTKVSAVSDENGLGLDALLNNKLSLVGGTMTGSLIFDNSTTSQKNEPGIKWGTYGSNTPYIGFATDQNDGTFILGSLKGTNYQSGLAIRGGSGNLLWKGERIATYTDIANYLPLAGGALSGHVYLTGAHASSSTGNTSQLIFGTSSNNHLAITSNTHALVLNPSSTTTTNQIVLYLDSPSVFPSGIRVGSANFTYDTTKQAVKISFI